MLLHRRVELRQRLLKICSVHPRIARSDVDSAATNGFGRNHPQQQNHRHNRDGKGNLSRVHAVKVVKGEHGYLSLVQISPDCIEKYLTKKIAYFVLRITTET